MTDADLATAILSITWYVSGLIGTGLIDYLDRSHGIMRMTFFGGLITSCFGFATLLFAVICLVLNNLWAETDETNCSSDNDQY